MKLVELKYKGLDMALFMTEGVDQYIKDMGSDFLDDPDEAAFFDILFPGQLEHIQQQAAIQAGWKNFWKDIKG